MKNKIVKILMFGVFMALPAFIFGQGSGSSGYPQPSGGGENIASENNFVVTRSSNGKVIGLKEGYLTIKDKKDKEIQVALTKDTKFKVGKKTVKVDELDEKLFTEGREVKITYAPFAKNPKQFYAVEVRFSDKENSKDKPILTKTS